jgi:hypothetical protein
MMNKVNKILNEYGLEADSAEVEHLKPMILTINVREISNFLSLNGTAERMTKIGER